MTQRIHRLRDELLDSIPEICPERAVIFTESMRKSEGPAHCEAESGSVL